jgi:hypothetical protein
VRLRSLAFAAVLVACEGGEVRDETLRLQGVWEADPSRFERLRVVEAAPEGPERDRVRAMIARDFEALTITFTADEALLQTVTSRRTVPYRIQSAQGPLVVLAGLHGDRTVYTTLSVEADRMTWFDADGQIEYVLRRR